ncbi:hypothetical protein [Cellulomonas fimi]|uniref:Uncharacterized protein n=1 Tax=Cellulomonas fimi TaxID=1708 RepID=A0A7Y0QGP3_CELFI|nr:hypothetical protein [Cellulomonas fimi]NMR19094.1 hypothetical protein [Cellulomonas fimi]
MSEQPGPHPDHEPEDAPSTPGSDGDGPEPGYTSPSQLRQEAGPRPGQETEETGADE